MSILDALKNYIRIRVGSSKANNISEAVKDLNSIPEDSGGVVVVTFTIDAETGDITASHTPTEVYELALSNMVIAKEIVVDDISALGSFISDNRGRFGFGVGEYQVEENEGSFRVSPRVYSDIFNMSPWEYIPG